MPRKKKTYVPDFLSLSLSAEGEQLLWLRVHRPIMITASQFEAYIHTHPDARKTAIAVTLLEVARVLLPRGSEMDGHLQTVISDLVLDELPMQDFTIPDDFPF